jgi:signal transduction histidine kinase
MTTGLDLMTSGAEPVSTGSRLGRLGRPATDRALFARVVPAVLVVTGALLLVPFRDIRATVSIPLAVGQLGPSAAVVDLMAGLLLMLAAIGAWLSGLAWRLGLLSALAGLAWFGPDLFALRDADPLMRVIGQSILSPMLWPLVLHLGTAQLGLDRRRDVRSLLLLLYGVAGIMALASATSYEAFWDPWCLDCQWDNPLVSGSGAMAAGRGVPALLRSGWVGLAVVTGMAAFRFVMRGRTVSDVRPTRRLVTLVAIGLVGVAAALRGWLLLTAPVQDPRHPGWLLDWALLTAGVLVMASVVIATAIATWQRRERMARLADSLVAAPRPGALAHELALALSDAELSMTYVLSDGRIVDPEGEAVAASDERDHVTTRIERDGSVLAHVHHSPTTDRAALAAVFGPALLVALDNERLRAAQLAQLLELRRSRARIVEVADATRRRLERDLHDGVQQLLIALVFDLKSLGLAFDRSGDAQGPAAMAALETRAQAAIDELRRIAHGMHPAILSRSGLEEALRSLADESPVPIEVRADGLGRMPDAIEATAYAVVTEMVADAIGRGARELVVKVHREGMSVHLQVRDDGRVPTSPPQDVIDRVEAVGGTTAVDATSDHGPMLLVDLPCG